MDWFDDVVLVATEGPKFTKAEIVANEVTRHVSEPSSTVDPLTWWQERAPTYPIISRLFLHPQCRVKEYWVWLETSLLRKGLTWNLKMSTVLSFYIKTSITVLNKTQVKDIVKCFWCFIVHLLFYRIHVSFIDLLLQNYTAVSNTHFHLNLPSLGLFHFIRTHGQSVCTSIFR